MMQRIQCAACGGEIQMEPGQPVRFCPYCGRPVEGIAPRGPSDLEHRLAAEKKPKKKYAMIMQALAASPDDFDANCALLFHGRLHEPMALGREVDFSIIKCHLLSLFDRPARYPAERLDAMAEELLRGPQLRRTMELAPDAETFFAEYLRRLSYEYVDLFVRGDRRNSSLVLGFNRSAASLARRCAGQVDGMLAEIEASDRLTEAERMLLMGTLREAFRRVFGESEGLLTR